MVLLTLINDSNQYLVHRKFKRAVVSSEHPPVVTSAHQINQLVCWIFIKCYSGSGMALPRAFVLIFNYFLGNYSFGFIILHCSSVMYLKGHTVLSDE